MLQAPFFIFFFTRKKRKSVWKVKNKSSQDLYAQQEWLIYGEQEGFPGTFIQK